MDVVASTLVHAVETTGETTAQCVTPDTTRKNAKRYPNCSYREDRLRKIPDLVRVTRQGLSAHDAIYGSNYLSQFEECRKYAWLVQYGDTGVMDCHSNSCRGRWCPMCAEARARFIARTCREFFENQNEVRMVTLTVKHTTDPLMVQERRLSKWRQALFRTVGWRKYVTGTFWALQPKPIRGGDEWHLHYHILTTGSFVPRKWLREKWQQITGSSYIVDVRPVRNLEKALSDVVRYVGRAANLLDVDFENMAELIHSTRRIRLCGTTGICLSGNGGISLRPPKAEKDGEKPKRIGRIESVWGLARQGDKDARAAAMARHTGEPVAVEIADRLWRKCRDVEGGFQGLSEVEKQRPPPTTAERWPQMTFGSDSGFGYGGGW